MKSCKQLKPGDVVKCIYLRNPQQARIAVGKYYQVVQGWSSDRLSNDSIFVINDEGNEEDFLADRFELAPDVKVSEIERINEFLSI